MPSRIALRVVSYSVARSRRNVETDGRLTSGLREMRTRRNSVFVILLNGIKADRNPRSTYRFQVCWSNPSVAISRSGCRFLLTVCSYTGHGVSDPRNKVSPPSHWQLLTKTPPRPSSLSFLTTASWSTGNFDFGSACKNSLAFVICRSRVR